MLHEPDPSLCGGWVLPVEGCHSAGLRRWNGLGGGGTPASPGAPSGLRGRPLGVYRRRISALGGAPAAANTGKLDVGHDVGDTAVGLRCVRLSEALQFVRDSDEQAHGDVLGQGLDRHWVLWCAGRVAWVLYRHAPDLRRRLQGPGPSRFGGAALLMDGLGQRWKR